MFTIYGGKTEFSQWEQGQRVTNPKLTVGDKVRFWNQSGETHPMIAYMHEGVVVADVPNDLLQHYSPILVELCGDPECLTRFIVNAQDKPKDYEFIDNTHCEPAAPSVGGGVTSWNDLKDRPFYDTRETIVTDLKTVTAVVNDFGFIKVAERVDFDPATVTHATRISSTGREPDYNNVPVVAQKGYSGTIIAPEDPDEYAFVLYFAEQSEADVFWGGSVDDGNPFTSGLYVGAGWSDDAGTEATVTYNFTYVNGELKTIDTNIMPEGYPKVDVVKKDIDIHRDWDNGEMNFVYPHPIKAEDMLNCKIIVTNRTTGEETVHEKFVVSIYGDEYDVTSLDGDYNLAYGYPNSVQLPIHNDDEYTSSIVGFGTEEVVTPIDPKFLPEGVGGGGKTVFDFGEENMNAMLTALMAGDTTAELTGADTLAHGIVSAIKENKALYLQVQGNVVPVGYAYNAEDDCIESIQFTTLLVNNGLMAVFTMVMFDKTIREATKEVEYTGATAHFSVFGSM